MQNSRKDPCDLGFPGAGIPVEAHMQAETGLALVAFCVCLDFPDHPLHGRKPNQPVQLFLAGQNSGIRAVGSHGKAEFVVRNIFVDIDKPQLLVPRSGTAQVLAHDDLI